MWRYLVLMFCLITVAWADSIETARQLSTQVQDRTGTGAQVNKNLAQPMMTEGQLTTIDGEKAFDAQLMCQSTNKLMTMTAQPQSSGDLRIISIAQDTNMDGELDAYSTPSWRISGVCANGFVQCTPGTWDNCESYRWAISQDNMITTERVGFTDLGGCYCINNHCGNQLAWSNFSSILGQLSTGAMSALARHHPFYGIADSHVDETSITFYGQNAQTCDIQQQLGSGSASHALGPTPTDLVHYNAEPHQLRSDADESKTSNDPYNRLLTSQFNQDGEVEYANCNISRINTLDEITLDDVISLESGDGNVSTDCGSDCVRLTLGTVGSDYWSGWCSVYHQHAAFFVHKPERIISAILKRAKWDDWIQVVANGKKIWSGPYNNWDTVGSMPPGACELSTDWDKSPNVNFTNEINQYGHVDFDVYVEVAGRGEGYALAEVQVDTACYLNPEEIVDDCAAYQQDEACNLYEETVDGVLTYHDRAATGLSPLPSTQTISGSGCSIPVNRPWFTKERTYICRRQRHYNIDNALTRSKYIREHVDTQHYHDRPFDNDGNQLSDRIGDMSLINPIDVPSCTYVCKTRKPKAKTEAALMGVTGDNLTTPIEYEFSYKACGLENVCPTEEGEEIIKPCQCLNEFAESTAIMQTMRLAGQDILCSTGQPQPLH